MCSTTRDTKVAIFSTSFKDKTALVTATPSTQQEAKGVFWEAGFVAILRDRNLAGRRFQALWPVEDKAAFCGSMTQSSFALMPGPDCFFGLAEACKCDDAGVSSKCFRKLVNNSDAGRLLVGHFGQAPENRSLAVCKLNDFEVQTTQGRTCRRSPCWQSSSFPNDHKISEVSQHLAIFCTPKPNLAQFEMRIHRPFVGPLL